MSKLRVIKRLSLSVFVASSFFAYALQRHEPVSEGPKVYNPSMSPNMLQIMSRNSYKMYRDGIYNGSAVRAGYGMVQVQAIIRNGKVFDIQFLDYPQQLQTSQKINARAMPWLRQEAIQGQSAQVNAVSGATITSQAFAASLQTALDLAGY